MFKRGVVGWILATALVLVGLAQSPIQPVQTPAQSTIVKFSDQGDQQHFLEQNQLDSKELQYIPELDAYVAPIKSDRVKIPPGVNAYPNQRYTALLSPNDPFYPQWYTDKVSAPQAWDISTGTNDITVAVIDTGFALDHQDLSSRWATNPGESGGGKESNDTDDDSNGYVDDWRGWDYSYSDNTPNAGSVKPNGQFVAHGSIVAGMVGATGNNGVGVASINWGTKILPIQALNDDGIGFTSTIATAIRYATDRGAKVISLSLGAPDPDSLIEFEIERANSLGVVVLAAAGNDGCNCIIYPANYPSVIAVGATDSNDNRASFSSYGPNLDVVAPGTGTIRTTYWTSANQTSAYTTTASGTSISTPLVAGLASLLKSASPSASPSEISGYIRNRADKVPGMGGAVRTDQYGHGRINALAALRAYTYSIVSQAAYTDSSKSVGLDLAGLSPGQTAWLVLKARNTGNITWTNSGSNPVRLGTEGPRDRSSRYATEAWPGANRPARLSEATVAPGAVGSFEFPIRVPAGGGEFWERFNLVSEGITWMTDTGLSFYTRVGGHYAWNLVSQQAYTSSTKTAGINLANLSPGQNAYLVVKARNAGNTVWYKAGSYPLRLGTSSPRDRSSTFRHPSWEGPNRPARLVEDSIAPGQVGTFEFPYAVPAISGVFREYFTPVAEGIIWLNDIGMNFYTGVHGHYAWNLVSQEAYSDSGYATAMDITAASTNQDTYWRLKIRNTGTATWFNSGPYPVRLGTSNPRDRSSPFATAGWLGFNRPTLLMENQVPPGQIGTFSFPARTPSSAGAYREYFTPVTEGITWMNEIGLNFYTVAQ